MIVEEPLLAPEPEKKPPRVKKARPPTPPESESEESSQVPTPPVAEAPVEPPSPRDLYKEASRLIFTLQHTKNDARRSRLQEQYTKGLLAL